MVAALGFLALTSGGASAETRSLKFYHLHTHEKAEIVYKRNGRYDAVGLKKINFILRDWRRDEPVKIDPRLLDLVWEAYRATGSHDYIQVICGYRAPATNSMLRSRSRGVAEKSQHMLGKALDFYIPGVPLKKLRDIGLKMQGGGVGYYPTSGSPFVHMDVGNVRHWPGISRQELVRVFPNGKTLHVPSDGRPLPGYEQALAAYKSRKSSGTTAIALASTGSSSKSTNLLAALFGGGADEEEDVADVEMAAAAPVKPVRVAKKAPASGGSLPGIEIVSPENAHRTEVPQVAVASADDAQPEMEAMLPEKIVAALPMRSVPLPAFAPRPKAEVGVQVAEASTDQPEMVPFETASARMPAPDGVPFPAAAAAPSDEAVEVAVNNIPLPSWRPKTAPAELNVPQDQKSVLMALADTAENGNSASDALSILPSERPDVVAVSAAGDDLAKQDRAQRDEVRAVLEHVSTDDYQVASLTQAPLPRSAFNDPSGVDAASPRTAVATRLSGSDPASAIGAGVKTTRKEARANLGDQRPEPKAVVVSAEPKVARWALHSADYVATVKDSTTAPRFAYNLVRTAPSEVYTNGFQSDYEMANANRFTGTAVKFLSVARFQTK
ncbi:MAG TPA: DUF882 domain-containing protein [Mesorhizobium sp.]